MKPDSKTDVDCNTKSETCMALQQDLLQLFFRRSCPPSQMLSEFYLEFLTPVEMAQVQAHLNECPHCPVELAELAQFLESSNEVDAQECDDSPDKHKQ